MGSVSLGSVIGLGAYTIIIGGGADYVIIKIGGGCMINGYGITFYIITGSFQLIIGFEIKTALSVYKFCFATSTPSLFKLGAQKFCPGLRLTFLALFILYTHIPSAIKITATNMAGPIKIPILNYMIAEKAEAAASLAA